MRQHILAVFPLSLAAVGLAQPPAAPPVIPAAGSAPAPLPRTAADAPLAGFEPLAAFPRPTQAAVRSVLLGSGWLARMNQPHGRFRYGYLPALGQPMEGHDDGHQAAAALALARAARFAGDERQAVVAGQTILALLAETTLAADGSRTPRTAEPVAFAANLTLAIYELPGADAKLAAEAERLCQYLRPTVGAGPLFSPEVAAVALNAVAASHRASPAAWKTEVITVGLGHGREAFSRSPSPALAAALIPAAAELAAQTKSADTAAAAFEMTDWLVALQYQPTDTRFLLRAGGFKGWADAKPVDAHPTAADTGACLRAIAAAYHLNRQTADLDRAARYRQAAQDAAQFLCGLQYAEANTRHFENGFRANVLIGGFYHSPPNGNLRIDATASALSGLVGYLTSGAEK